MVLFLNGPIQNSDFTFQNRPGKAVGLRLASILNGILGRPEAPHLWNTVMLAGDVLHRDQVHAGFAPLPRRAFEHARLMGKYTPDLPPPSELITDADPAVATLALDMIDARLSQGSLRIERRTLQECASCGHMIGPVATWCTACGGTRLRTHRSSHLVHDLAGEDLSVSGRVHGIHRKRHRHVDAMSAQVPRCLLLSRTRSHGIRLDPLGLDGLVLDPRTGLHVTVLSAARKAGAAEVAMTATARAVSHIAAHGFGFTSWRGYRLRYAIHGYVPYEEMPALERTYTFHGVTPGERQVFETRFLPLAAWQNKGRTHPAQLAPLLKYFLKVHRGRPVSTDTGRLDRIREEVGRGGTSWVMNKYLLAAVMEEPVERTENRV